MVALGFVLISSVLKYADYGHNHRASIVEAGTGSGSVDCPCFVVSQLAGEVLDLRKASIFFNRGSSVTRELLIMDALIVMPQVFDVLRVSIPITADPPMLRILCGFIFTKIDSMFRTWMIVELHQELRRLLSLKYTLNHGCFYHHAASRYIPLLLDSHHYLLDMFHNLFISCFDGCRASPMVWLTLGTLHVYLYTHLEILIHMASTFVKEIWVFDMRHWEPHCILICKEVVGFVKFIHCRVLWFDALDAMSVVSRSCDGKWLKVILASAFV
ncbi:hypothetical protein F8388_020336 [Cannabis sativa]|uniref:Uncharacterized protein n=1 Tax=Cannabis sativa TaxID=3483 RepID=A0A7J6HHS3_CANSA|nr:hypothetical protein F8388_020336 [Cannabis sativa]